MPLNYPPRPDRSPRFRPLNEEDDAARYKRQGWDPRKTHAENMGHESLFDRPEDDFGWPEPARQRRAPTRQVRELAAAGRGEDTEIAHVARGEYVIPQAFLTPELLVALRRAAAAKGVPLERLIVGNAQNRINPHTGVPEFAFDEMTPEMEAFANRATNMKIPIQPPADESWKYPLTRDLLPGPDISRPAFDIPLRPQQYMGPAPRPLHEDVINDPRMMPSFKDQVIASLPTDPEARTRVYASALFPDDKYEDVKNHFFQANGRTAYINPDGGKYYAEPSLKLPTNAQNFDETVKWAGSMVGPSMDDAGAAVGGFIGQIGGPVGVYRGAVLGAGGGDALRQYAASHLTNEQKPWRDRLLQTGTAAADKALDVKNLVERYGYRR